MPRLNWPLSSLWGPEQVVLFVVRTYRAYGCLVRLLFDYFQYAQIQYQVNMLILFLNFLPDYFQHIMIPSQLFHFLSYSINFFVLMPCCLRALYSCLQVLIYTSLKFQQIGQFSFFRNCQILWLLVSHVQLLGRSRPQLANFCVVQMCLVGCASLVGFPFQHNSLVSSIVCDYMCSVYMFLDIMKASTAHTGFRFHYI